MTKTEFDKKLNERASETYNRIKHAVVNTPTGEYGAFAVITKELAACSLMIELLFEHTKMPPIDTKGMLQ